MLFCSFEIFVITTTLLSMLQASPSDRCSFEVILNYFAGCSAWSEVSRQWIDYVSCSMLFTSRWIQFRERCIILALLTYIVIGTDPGCKYNMCVDIDARWLHFLDWTKPASYLCRTRMTYFAKRGCSSPLGSCKFPRCVHRQDFVKHLDNCERKDCPQKKCSKLRMLFSIIRHVLMSSVLYVVM
jgi:hypothetical protein